MPVFMRIATSAYLLITVTASYLQPVQRTCPLSDTDRVKAWRKRRRQEGKAPVTVWLSREEKRRLEALTKTWHCSTSELVQQALAQFQPETPTGTGAAPATEQLRQLVTATVTDIVTVTLPELVRDLVGEIVQKQVSIPITAPDNSNETVTRTLRDRPANQPSPEKAAVIARLQAMRTTGLSFEQMATQLCREGLPTLSGKGTWQKGTIAKLLKSQ
jgi:hypothetical protein